MSKTTNHAIRLGSPMQRLPTADNVALKSEAPRTPVGAKVVFLFDVDNTLLDNDRILVAIKKIWGVRVTTVFVRQGHYARDPKILACYAPTDTSIERIGDLLDFQFKDFLPNLTKRHRRLRGAVGS